MDQETLPSGDSPVNDHDTEGSEYEEPIARKKGSKTGLKAKTSTTAKAKAKAGAANPRNGSKDEGSKLSEEVVNRARIIQMDSTTKFTIWKEDMGDGDPETWPEDRILYDPVGRSPCENAEEFWGKAPKNTYISDRGVQLLLHAGVPRAQYRRFFGADFDRAGNLLSNRRPRGLPALDLEGNFVQYSEKWLHGDCIQVDRKKYAYKVPEIGSANGSKKGPAPIWNPRSREAYIALHKPTPKTEATAENARPGSNQDLAAVEYSEDAATESTPNTRRRSPPSTGQKRQLSVNDVQQSLPERPSKRSKTQTATELAQAATLGSTGPPSAQESQQLHLQINTLKSQLTDQKKKNKESEKKKQEKSVLAESFEAALTAADEVNAGLQSKLESFQEQQAQWQQEKAQMQQEKAQEKAQKKAAVETLCRGLNRIAKATIDAKEQQRSFPEPAQSKFTTAREALQKFRSTPSSVNRVHMTLAAGKFLEAIVPAVGDATFLDETLTSIENIKKQCDALAGDIELLPAPVKDYVKSLVDLSPDGDGEISSGSS